jgi:hypothetical protein
MVRSAADVHTIIAALTFPPAGNRGRCPALRVPGYTVTGFNGYMRDNDAELLIVAMIDPTEDGCAQALDDGVSMLCIGLDVLAFRQLCETTVAAANAAVEANPTYNRPPAPPSAFPHSY